MTSPAAARSEAVDPAAGESPGRLRLIAVRRPRRALIPRRSSFSMSSAGISTGWKSSVVIVGALEVHDLIVVCHAVVENLVRRQLGVAAVTGETPADPVL